MPAAEGTKLSAPPALNNDGSGASATLARMHHLSINYEAAEIKPTIPRGEVLGRKVTILEWQGLSPRCTWLRSTRAAPPPPSRERGREGKKSRFKYGVEVQRFDQFSFLTYNFVL